MPHEFIQMQTIAANLGSMLTPIGNPQNLYLYGKSGMSIGGFVLLMLPYTLVSLLLLLAWAALVCRKASAALSVDEFVSSSASQGDQKIILLYLVLFAVCLLPGRHHLHPHGHPCVLHCLPSNPIFTICIFIPLSPTLARNRKKPLTEESFKSLYPSI